MVFCSGMFDNTRDSTANAINTTNATNNKILQQYPLSVINVQPIQPIQLTQST
jgi:hypothetical protein